MSCCKPTNENGLGSTKPAIDIVDIVNAAYSARAREGVTATYANNVAAAFGYTEEQLSSVPEGAHMGLSCGNPVATAHIKEGETVVDLGSGGGIDVFLAASKVGTKGKVIGLDMSKDMIALARKHAAQKNLKPPHVAFALLTEPLPIESNSVDCILSNCVVNLLPLEGKVSLLKEVHRILKPGGRIVFDDTVAKKELPESIRADLASYVGCISGAILVEEYKELLQQAGLSNALFVNTKNDLRVYYEDGEDPANTPGCCTPAAPPGSRVGKPDYDVNEWVVSYQIYALKEGTPTNTPPNALLRWWDAYPVVQSSPTPIAADEVADLLRKGSSADFAVIDVRRNDHTGGHVRGSYNFFAQTFYDDLPAFYEKFKGTPKVIFYCQSSNGRGPRSAGWYQDYIDAQTQVEGAGPESAAFVLTGGIKNWLSKFAGDDDLVDRD